MDSEQEDGDARPTADALYVVDDGTVAAARMVDALAGPGKDLPAPRVIPATMLPRTPVEACVVLPLGAVDSGLQVIRTLRAQGHRGAIVLYADATARPPVACAAVRAGAQDVLAPVTDPPAIVRRCVQFAMERAPRPALSRSDAPKQWVQDRFLEAQALARVGSWEVDVRTWSVEWSPEFRRIMGIGLYEPPLELEAYAARVHQDDRERVVGELLGLFERGRLFDSEHRLVHPDGEQLFVHAVGRCVVAPDGSVLRAYGTTQDVTERKLLEIQLAERSMRDELTGLYNRRGFMELAERQLNLAGDSARTHVLFFADLNGMKHINDRFGHDEGDRALRDAANVLMSSLRPTDIIARFGGDEFVALGLDVDVTTAEALSEQIRSAFRDAGERDQRGYRLSASVGFTLYESSRPASIQQLLNEADKQMYQAKEQRKLHGSPSLAPRM